MNLIVRCLHFIIFVVFIGCRSDNSFGIERVAGLPEKLIESSGLAYTSHGLFSLSDNKSPEIYRIDLADGKILQTLIISNHTFSDKEALSFDEDYLYIGDFGNNKDNRTDLKIVKVKFEDITDEEVVRVDGEAIFFYYPEQQHFSSKKRDRRFDCEAMVVLQDSIYLFTKQRSDHHTTVYALPKDMGTYAAIKSSEFNAEGLITDAAFHQQSNTLLLLGYLDKHQFPFIWKFEGFANTAFFKGSAQKISLHDSPLDWQTEGITFIFENEVFISCETTPEVSAGLYKFTFPLND
jgi:hypothetical protein